MSDVLAVRELASLDDLSAAGALFDRIWGQQAGTLMPTNLLRALQHAGGYLAGAFEGAVAPAARTGATGALVGASVGFLGWDRDALVLHSHITGAAAGAQGRGVGLALKQHQRRWCLERGITTVVWTFDPLVARNAYFNLHKLGAVATAYLPDFYGAMPDAINAGDPTDRLLAAWRLDEPRGADRGTASERPWAAASALLDADDADDPRVGDPAWGQPLRCRVPADVLALRRSDAAAALRWRLAVREALTAAFARGYRAVDASRDGAYLLVPGAEPA